MDWKEALRFAKELIDSAVIASRCEAQWLESQGIFARSAVRQDYPMAFAERLEMEKKK